MVEKWGVVTLASAVEKGGPLSRANDHNCREAVAISAMQAHVRSMMGMATMKFVPG